MPPDQFDRVTRVLVLTYFLVLACLLLAAWMLPSIATWYLTLRTE